MNPLSMIANATIFNTKILMAFGAGVFMTHRLKDLFTKSGTGVFGRFGQQMDDNIEIAGERVQQDVQNLVDSVLPVRPGETTEDAAKREVKTGITRLFYAMCDLMGSATLRMLTNYKSKQIEGCAGKRTAINIPLVACMLFTTSTTMGAAYVGGVAYKSMGHDRCMSVLSKAFDKVKSMCGYASDKVRAR